MVTYEYSTDVDHYVIQKRTSRLLRWSMLLLLTTLAALVLVISFHLFTENIEWHVAIRRAKLPGDVIEASTSNFETPSDKGGDNDRQEELNKENIVEDERFMIQSVKWRHCPKNVPCDTQAIDEQIVNGSGNGEHGAEGSESSGLGPSTVHNASALEDGKPEGKATSDEVHSNLDAKDRRPKINQTKVSKERGNAESDARKSAGLEAKKNKDETKTDLSESILPRPAIKTGQKISSDSVPSKNIIAKEKRKKNDRSASRKKPPARDDEESHDLRLVAARKASIHDEDEPNHEDHDDAHRDLEQETNADDADVEEHDTSTSSTEQEHDETSSPNDADDDVMPYGNDIDPAIGHASTDLDEETTEESDIGEHGEVDSDDLTHAPVDQGYNSDFAFDDVDGTNEEHGYDSTPYDIEDEAAYEEYLANLEYAEYIAQWDRDEL